MNMHVAVPGKTQDSRARRLGTQERKRQKTLQRVAGLRREASEEITRLIAFLDATDTYVQTECEINGDEADQSYREGFFAADNPMEDDEDGADDEYSIGPDDLEMDRSDDEPSLGWTVEGSTAGPTDDRERQDYAREPAKKRKKMPAKGVRQTNQVWGARDTLTGLTDQQAVAFKAKRPRHSPISVR